MYATNAWYVCAMSDEIGRELLGRTILDEPLVMYRTEGGSPVILEDRCAHRRLPLTKGCLVGDIVQCGYHGLQYEPSGKCVHIPGQTGVPPAARVRSFPVAERHGWTFVWIGDPALASQNTIPDFATKTDDSSWHTMRGLLDIKCNHKLVLDNLLDLSHLAYVHSKTTGNVQVAENAVVKTTVKDDRVRVTRVMENVAAAMVYAEYGGFKGAPIDRWQITEYIPPCYYYINNGSELTSNRATNADRIEGQGTWGFQVYHGITPERANTTHQFWQISYPKNAVPPRDKESFEKVLVKVLFEDFEVYEAQQQAIELLSDEGRDGAVNPLVAIEADAGLIHARRILDRMALSE